MTIPSQPEKAKETFFALKALIRDLEFKVRCLKPKETPMHLTERPAFLGEFTANDKQQYEKLYAGLVKILGENNVDIFSNSLDIQITFSNSFFRAYGNSLNVTDEELRGKVADYVSARDGDRSEEKCELREFLVGLKKLKGNEAGEPRITISAGKIEWCKPDNAKMESENQAFTRALRHKMASAGYEVDIKNDYRRIVIRDASVSKSAEKRGTCTKKRFKTEYFDLIDRQPKHELYELLSRYCGLGKASAVWEL